MLEELSIEQEAKMLEVRDFWKDYIFSCKNSINKEQAKIGIDFIYRLAKLKQPKIIYVDSPMGCQIANMYLKGYLKVLKQQLPASVGDSVRDSVWDSVRASVRASYEDFASYGNISDYGWVSFYDFFTQIGVLDNEEYNKFKNILLSGIYDMIQLDGFCIVSNMPDRVERDEQGRLHSETTSSIHFRDGYEQYYWHGVFIPKEWVMNKKSITKEVFLSETNAEKRRCLQEIIGNEKLIEIMEVEIIDEDFEETRPNDNVESSKHPLTLYRTKEKDSLLDDFIYFLNVIDPSTGRKYYICVPECKNVWDAKAWTFQIKK